MATIKDIARAAGVSQGTVSNVLNGKGNVSSVKIRQVQQAAEQLGYALNQRAQALRRGSSRQLAVVLPHLYSRTYVDFFSSFRNYAHDQGYQVLLYLTDDMPEKERQAVEEMQSAGVAGAAVFTCLQDGGEAYRMADIRFVRFVERSPGANTPVLTFDYFRMGCEMAAAAMREHCQHPVAMTENTSFSSQSAFLQGLRSVLGIKPLKVVQTHNSRCAADLFDLLKETPAPDALFVSNYGVACTLESLRHHVTGGAGVKIYALSPVFTLPDGTFSQYELNYRLMGRRACEQLLGALAGGDIPEGEQLLVTDGQRDWTPQKTAKPAAKLTVVTPESPSTSALRSLACIYTQKTGVEVQVIACSYEGLDELLSNVENTELFDVIRLDSKRLAYYAERVYEPLVNIDPNIEEVFDSFFPGLSRTYTHASGVFYVLPHTPSVQLMFYRRDLFENSAFRRQYQELYGHTLEVPVTYEEYNRVARFFTRTFNPDSPVPYGASLILGDMFGAAKEFLSRYFSHSRSLYDDQGRILLNTPTGIQAMRELVELRTCVDVSYCSSWRDALKNFIDERTAMSVLYTNFSSNIVSSRSRISDRIGYAMVPGGNPMLGGGVVGVCRTSRQKPEALRFLRWLCSPEVTTANTLMGSVSPCKKTYENYEVMDRYPWLSMAEGCFAVSSASHVPPNYDGPFGEPKFLSILGTAVNMAFSGAVSPEDALKLAQSSYEKAFGKT